MTRVKHRFETESRNNRHAVVLGGSLAGLLTARVLSDHFDHVTLIERDLYSDTAETRRGIPQANHVHGLLARGCQILEELFPGLQDEMVAAGAPQLDMANEIAWFTPAGWGIRFPSDLSMLSFTRPLLDLHVRRRLAMNPRVEIRDNTDVLRLVPDSVPHRLAGVLICSRTTETDRRVAKELHADLVVDTTGYGQGMTTAALGAMALDRCLRERDGELRGLSHCFQKRLAKIIQAPWLLATGEDYRYPDTIGGSPTLMTKFMHRYMDHVVQLSTRSAVVRKVLLETFNMLLPPSALFQPRVLFRVLLDLFRPAPRKVHSRRRQVVFKQSEA